VSRKSPASRAGIRESSSRIPPGQSSAFVWFLVISAVAFSLRLIHLLQLRHNDPFFLSPQMDSLYHHQWALAVAAGQEFIAGAFFRAPLYPYFLGLLYKLFGANLMVVRITQSLVGSASCGLVYLLARQLLKPQAARKGSGVQGSKGSGPGPRNPSTLEPHPSDAVPRIAGLVMAAYPLAIWFDGELLLEGLLTFLVLLGLVLLLRSRDTGRQWGLPGIAFGLAAITRPNVLAFLALLPVWFLIEDRHGVGSPKAPQITSAGRKKRGRNTVCRRLLFVWGAAALVILPVTVRNYVVSGEFVPIAWQAGTNFYIGNSPESDGLTAIVPGTRGTWWGGFNDVKRLAEEAAGRPLKGAEIDRYWMARGLEFWHRQPGKALGLLLRKTFYWFAGYEFSNDRILYDVKRYSFINYLFFNSRFLKFPFGILLPLALAGVWLCRSQWRRFLPVYLFAGAYSLSFIIFFVCSRYRMPLVPIVAIFAAIGLMGLAGPVAKRERAIAFGIVLGAFLLLNVNFAAAGRVPGRDQNYFAIATDLHQQGKDAEALAEVRRGLGSDSLADVLKFEAMLLAGTGDFAEAERAARAVVRLYPSDTDSYEALAGVLVNARQYDSAAVYYEIVRSRDPYSFEAWNNLGNIALLRKDFAKARYYYEGALKLRPADAAVITNLGICEYYQGQIAEARARWQEALKLDPSFTRAKQALGQLK
jgi:tetratricopeptide (TPR) repeat protein